MGRSPKRNTTVALKVPELSDAELVARLKAHDEEAYREVMARYGDALFWYIYNITRNQHLSEDILSETYLRMVEKIDSYVFSGIPFKSWLYRVAHNLAINALKRANRSTHVDDLDAAAHSTEDPAAAIDSQLEAEELRVALTQLTEEQQQVVLLRFVAEQSPGEIAQTMAKTEGAVKQLQLRALRSLGRLLGR